MKTKALVIDDDLSARKIVSYLFWKQGVNVIEAKDGEEGIPYLLNENPRIVILDWRMPNLNGQDTIILSEAILNEINRVKDSRHQEKHRLLLYTSVKLEELALPTMKHFRMLGYIHKGWSIDYQKRKFDLIIKKIMAPMEAT